MAQGPQRIMIVGSPGAGKSTLTQRLHEITGHEIITLDEHYFAENWVEPDPEDWIQTVTELAARPNWIMDGNYSGSMHVRFPRADMIIFLDHPTLKLLRRVLWRTLKNWGKTRPGMPEGCPERFDLEFIHYVLHFNRTRRKALLRRLEEQKKDKPIFILRNNGEIEDFIQEFAQELSVS